MKADRSYSLCMAALAAATFFASAQAQTGDEAICGVNPNERYGFTGKFQPDPEVSPLLFAGAERRIKVLNDGLRFVVNRTRQGNGDEASAIRFQCESCPAPDNEVFVIGAEDFDTADHSVMTPVFFGNVRVWSEDGAPLAKIDTYAIEGRPRRQLGVIDASSAAQPNWCHVNEYAGSQTVAGDEPPDARARHYTPGPANFGAAVNSVAAIAYVVGTHKRNNEKQISMCSGVFITPSLVLTNRHCVCPAAPSNACPNEKEFVDAGLYDAASWQAAESALYARTHRVWSRTAVADQSAAPTFQNAVLVHAGQAPPGERPLDYAILKVSGAPDQAAAIAPAKIFPNARLSDGAKVAVPQYPGNYPFSINYDSNCLFFTNYGGEVEYGRRNIDGVPSDYRYGLHGCDTGKGSSGSPLFTRDLAGVIGLHYCCWNGDDTYRFGNESVKADGVLPEGDALDRGMLNRFALISSILCDVRSRNPALFETIANEGEWASGGEDDVVCQD